MRVRGFTLVELAIVLVVLGLIVGLGVPMLESLIKENQLNGDRSAVRRAREVLLGYAYEHGGFPRVYDKNYVLTLSF